jgi:hypothetical protein
MTSRRLHAWASATHPGRMPSPARARGRAALALALVSLSVVVSACASGGGGRSAQSPATSAPADAARSPLEGEWSLTSFQLADGSTRRVTGFLRVDRFSTLTLHAELALDDPAARPPRTVVADFTARASALEGSLDYVGLSMGVGTERLTADAVPMAEWRHYELAGDTLRLSVRDRSGRTAATLVFERAAAPWRA